MKDKKKFNWYLLVAVALLLGILIGYFATNAIVTGNATTVFVEETSELTSYEKYAMNEMDQYIEKNNLDNVFVYRESTDGKEIPGVITDYDLKKYTPILTSDEIIFIDNITGEIKRAEPKVCAHCTYHFTDPNTGIHHEVTLHYEGKARYWVLEKDIQTIR